MNTLIDDRLKKLRFDHTDTIDGFNTLCEEDIAQIKSELLKAILASKPEKLADAGNYGDATYGEGHNQALDQWEEAIKELFGEKE